MARPQRNDALPRLVVGLTVIAAGAAFWSGNTELFHWWPYALIVLGIAHFPHRRWIGGIVWIVMGAYFLFPHVEVWRILGLWPLLITVAGATLMMQALRSAKDRRSFHAVAVMAGNVRGIGSQQFTGGDAIAVMGGCEIDLTSATLAPDAAIDVLAFWGGVEIRVPDGWRVVNQVTALLGGVTTYLSPAPPDAPTLILRGAAIMGGVEVRH